jgi:hypothetical protein
MGARVFFRGQSSGLLYTYGCRCLFHLLPGLKPSSRITLTRP